MGSINEKFSLEGKNALVICPENNWGSDVVKGLVAAGCRVFLAGPDEAAMKAMDGTVGYMVYDHRTKAQAAAMVETAKAALGTIDVMVENSLYTPVRGWDQSYALIYSQLEGTHLGMMLTVQAVGNAMAEQGSGSVIIMTETGALSGYDIYNYQEAPEQFDTDFSLVKGFIYGGAVNYTRQAAGFLGENGCRCNCLVCAPCGGEAGFQEAYLRHSHLKTPAAGENIADAVCFLASDAAAYITGAILPVDGGYTAK